jgi:hypothetical protein
VRYATVQLAETAHAIRIDGGLDATNLDLAPLGELRNECIEEVVS